MIHHQLGKKYGVPYDAVCFDPQAKFPVHRLCCLPLGMRVKGREEGGELTRCIDLHDYPSTRESLLRLIYSESTELAARTSSGRMEP